MRFPLGPVGTTALWVDQWVARAGEEKSSFGYVFSPSCRSHTICLGWCFSFLFLPPHPHPHPSTTTQFTPVFSSYPAPPLESSTPAPLESAVHAIATRAHQSYCYVFTLSCAPYIPKTAPTPTSDVAWMCALGNRD